jgi:iron only hydrogenase large subunit-like protein
MFKKNNITKILSELKKKKMVALVAPSFVADFEYPNIINYLREMGFDKVVELTFGAKMVNREYRKILENNPDKLLISTACPGIVNTIKNNFPEYSENLIPVDSPMIAMAKICKKHFPKHKTVFISPCDLKKLEAEKSKYVDYVIDYDQLREIINKIKIKNPPKEILFDKFYNDYTKIYPLSGGLSKTAHLKGVIKKNEIIVIDGINEVLKFLKKPDKKIKFLDVLFCDGGCIGGPHTLKISIKEKKKKVLNYLKESKKEDIPENRKGLLEKAEGINFIKKY